MSDPHTHTHTPAAAGWLSATRRACDQEAFSPYFSRTNGLLDFAGSGVVHMVGGAQVSGGGLGGVPAWPALLSLQDRDWRRKKKCFEMTCLHGMRRDDAIVLPAPLPHPLVAPLQL